MVRWLAIVTALCSLLWSAGSGAQPVSDNQLNAQVVSAIMQQLSGYALFQNGSFYTYFEISSQSAPPPPPGGFAPPLTPQGIPIIRRGVIAVKPYPNPSISVFQSADGVWRGVANWRLQGYQIYADGRGWLNPASLTLHMWEWNVQADANGLQVIPKMDNTNFPTDNGPRELVASIFTISPGGVTVEPPGPAVMAQIMGSGGGAAPNAPARRACRPCETEAPDGTCRPWRACY